MYLLYASREKSAPRSAIITQENAEALQPILSAIAPIPYMDIAAPTYVQAFENPLAVAALPNLANRPGRQDINKKFIACINPQTKAARIRQTSFNADCSKLIRTDTGTQSAAAQRNKTNAPRASLLKKRFLCIAIIEVELTIEIRGIIAETRIASSALVPKASP